jgi:hypothetical protein
MSRSVVTTLSQDPSSEATDQGAFVAAPFSERQIKSRREHVFPEVAKARRRLSIAALGSGHFAFREIHVGIVAFHRRACHLDKTSVL